VVGLEKELELEVELADVVIEENEDDATVHWLICLAPQTAEFWLAVPSWLLG
jgi:hypothetical protein